MFRNKNDRKYTCLNIIVKSAGRKRMELESVFLTSWRSSPLSKYNRGEWNYVCGAQHSEK